MSCKYNNSMYTIIEPQSMNGIYDYEDDLQEIIEEHLLDEEFEDADFKNSIIAIDEENRRMEAETSYLIKNMDNHVFIPSEWEDSFEPAARDLHKINKMGKMNLVRFVQYLQEYNIFSKSQIEELLHGFCNHLESKEVLDKIEQDFHRMFGVIE